MKPKINIDFSEFNQHCRSLGLDPYVIDKVSIDYQDRDLFILSVKNLEEGLHRWIENQIKK